MLFYFYAMRKWLQIQLKSTEQFVSQLVECSSEFEHFLLFNSNRNHITSHSYSSFEILAACDSIKKVSTNDNHFDAIKKFNQENNDWIFGHLNYDLKNDLEDLTSANFDSIEFPEFFFFIPRFVFKVSKSVLEVGFIESHNSENDAIILIEKIQSICINKEHEYNNIRNIQHNFSKSEYLEEVKIIKKHILLGDIYELNFCTEFLAKNANINPSSTYIRLNSISPAPFSGFYKLKDKYLISSSPERFLAKRENKIISQPIKGTIKRGHTGDEDEFFKKKLKTDIKERAENIMIVDLVRNDLSRSAKVGSVNVEELCEIYSYKYVHQMISTVVSELDEEQFDIIDAIKTSFPMGSMTGAPKIKAMELIEKFERSKRGLYSGCIGYITPEKNFDFNVVIRSILYNITKQILSFSVGSAITFKSDPEKEYEECLLKAEAMKKVLS